jgi:hypothetical protein
MGFGDYLKPLVSIATAYLGYQIGGPVGGAIGWGLGMGVGGALFPPEAEKTSAQSLGPAQQLTPQANYGAVIPLLYGSRRIAGNIIWYIENITATPANIDDWEAFAATATRYGYTGTFFASNFANAVCIGPATVTRIYNGKDEYICDGNHAYKINVGDNVPVEYINKTPEETLDMVMQAGTPYDFSYTEYRGDQTAADPTIAAAQGENVVPPYRNLCYLIIHNFPVKDLNSEIPSFTFEVSTVEGVDNPTPVYSDHVHIPTNTVPYYYGSFAYRGYVYILDSELTSGYYLLSTMKKYTQDLSTLVATYTFEKRYLSGPRDLSAYYAPIFNISVDEHNGRVLIVGMCGILIDMNSLSEISTNYYKVFSETSEYAAYTIGSTIYYASREGAAGYGGNDRTKYIPLTDQYLSNTPATENPGLTPLGSMRGLLLPSTTYFLSPSEFGFKKQSISTGAITDYVIPTGTSRGFTPSENWGDGPYWDHTMVEQFVLGDDGFVYVALHIVYARYYFGLFDPLGKYDILLLRYAIGPDGELTEAARRLYSDMTTLTVLGRIDGWPIYTISHISLSVSKGYAYLSFRQPTGDIYLIKLNATDLSVILSTTGMHYAGSAVQNAGYIKIFKQRYGVDKLVYYCAQGHVHILDTSFTDDETAVSLYEPSVYSFAEGGIHYPTGMRGDGYMIFPGWDGASIVFKYMDFDPEYTRLTDVAPQMVSEDILTNEFYGEGLNTSILETTMTAEAEQYAIDNDLLISVVFDQQRSVLDALSYVAGHHNGFYTTGGGLIAHRQLEIDDDDLVWTTSASLSDTFNDGVTGTQWLKYGDALITDLLSVYSLLSFQDNGQVVIAEYLRSVVQQFSIGESGIAYVYDPTIYNLQVVDSYRIRTEFGWAEIAFSGGEVTEHIPANEDDGHAYGTEGGSWSNFSNSSMTIMCGISGGNEYGAYFRFTTVDVPKDATITEATLYATPGYIGGAFDFRVYMNDVDSASRPTSASNVQNATLTDAYTTYNAGDLSVDSYAEFDVTDAVQEVVNRGSWSSGNNMMALLRYNDTDDYVISFYSKNMGYGNDAYLYIVYS